MDTLLHCRWVIGKEGSFIKQLEERSKAAIRVSDSACQEFGRQWKYVQVQGTPRAVDRAKSESGHIVAWLIHTRMNMTRAHHSFLPNVHAHTHTHTLIHMQSCCTFGWSASYSASTPRARAWACPPAPLLLQGGAPGA